MTRFNLQFGGKTEELLNRIKGRKKSIILNSIVGEAIKTGKIKDYLITFFSNEEIEQLLDFTKKSSLDEKTDEKVKIADSTNTIESIKNDSFKIQI